MRGYSASDEIAGVHGQGFPLRAGFLSCPKIRNTSCLIVDAHMPRMTGIELHRRLVESGYAVPTILSGYLDDSVRARALADGIICYLTKPCDEDALFGCAHRGTRPRHCSGRCRMTRSGSSCVGPTKRIEQQHNRAHASAMTVRRPSGFIQPCLPSKVARPQFGPLCVYELPQAAPDHNRGSCKL